jgi:hypothetical protein
VNSKIYYLSRIFWRAKKHKEGLIALPLVPLNDVASYNPRFIKDKKRFDTMYRISYSKKENKWT